MLVGFESQKLSASLLTFNKKIPPNSCQIIFLYQLCFPVRNTQRLIIIEERSTDSSCKVIYMHCKVAYVFDQLYYGPLSISTEMNIVYRLCRS